MTVPIQSFEKWISQPAGAEYCDFRSMNMTMLKTKEDVDFALKWMANQEISLMNIRGTIVR